MSTSPPKKKHEKKGIQQPQPPNPTKLDLCDLYVLDVFLLIFQRNSPTSVIYPPWN